MSKTVFNRARALVPACALAVGCDVEGAVGKQVRGEGARGFGYEAIKWDQRDRLSSELWVLTDGASVLRVVLSVSICRSPDTRRRDR